VNSNKKYRKPSVREDLYKRMNRQDEAGKCELAIVMPLVGRIFFILLALVSPENIIIYLRLVLRATGGLYILLPERQP